MSDTKSVSLRDFPRPFWIANLLEIFERMGWYGFYAVSSLYLTGSRESGGLGLSSEDRGVIQGLATFFLYLFPAVFGAIADRYGFKKMFMASFLVMVPGYLLLGTAQTFWSFLLIYLLVAVGHGMFKPVVIATVAKSTDEKTGTLGFGIFYMMVNIGGFVGPLVAAYVRGWGWDFVFYASAVWCGLNLLWCGLFYREPSMQAARDERKTIGDVLKGMVEVVGNGRFFTLIFGLLLIMVMGSKWVAWPAWGYYALIWIAANLGLDFLLRLGGKDGGEGTSGWTMRVGDTRYLVFLLLMAGFWVSFNQIFMTVPEYIRDYTNTDDIVRGLAPLNIFQDTTNVRWFENGQLKPELLINLNALGIILFQVIISYLARKLKPFTTIISGIVVTILSFLVFFKGAQGWFVVLAILVFSVGEMLASPKSKEYAGRIAPSDKVGMYMGYFYWCVALGNLFGGILSGQAYAHYGPKGVDNPETMWWIFSGLAAITAIGLALYNRWVTRPEIEPQG